MQLCHSEGSSSSSVPLTICVLYALTHTHTHVHTGTLDGRREGEEEKRFSVAAAFRALFFGAAMRELLL